MTLSKTLSMLFDAYENDIPRLEETDKADEIINGLYKKLDKDLLDEYDIAMGKIIRTYLKTGFYSGFKLGVELLTNLKKIS